MNSYNKLSLSIPEQAQLLLDKGLICNDRERLERYLSTIGYYRLKVYWLPYLSKDKQFLPNTTFDQILKLYIFDRKLRLLVAEALERIEVTLRAHWSNKLANNNNGGSHAYMNPSFFRSVKRLTYLQEFKELESKLNSLKPRNEKQKSPEDFIQHYKDNYDSPLLPPIWGVTEIMTFGMLSRWFQITKDNVVEKESIIQWFGMPTTPKDSFRYFESILHNLTLVRNICAHHGRLWDRQFVFSLPDKYCAVWMKGRFNDTNTKKLDNHLFNYLVVIEALLRAISPKTSWKNRLMELLKTIEPGNYKKMGFPDNWQEREPWKSNVS